MLGACPWALGIGYWALLLLTQAIKKVISLSAGYPAVCRTSDALNTVQINVGSGEGKDPRAEMVIPEAENSCLAVMELCRYLMPRAVELSLDPGSDPSASAVVSGQGCVLFQHQSYLTTGTCGAICMGTSAIHLLWDGDCAKGTKPKVAFPFPWTNRV